MDENLESTDFLEFSKAYRQLSRDSNNVNKYLKSCPATDQEAELFENAKVRVTEYFQKYGKDQKPLFRIFEESDSNSESLLSVFGSTCAAILQLAAPLGKAFIAADLADLMTNEHAKKIEKALKSKKPFIISPLLRALTSLVALGPAKTTALFGSIDFTHPSFAELFERTSKPEIKNSTGCKTHLSLRELFIYFLMAALRHGSLVVKQTVSKVLHGVFFGLKHDTVDIVSAVCTTICEHLLMDPMVLKTTVVQLFSVSSLKCLAKALAVATDSKILAALEKLLWQVCGIASDFHGLGMRFSDSGWYKLQDAKGALRNPNLAQLVSKHLDITGCQPHGAFALRLLSQCCELRPIVWQNASLHFGLAERERCIASLAFWAAMLELELPPVQQNAAPDFDLAVHSLMPPSMTRLAVQKGVQHSDPELVLAWLRCVRLLCCKVKQIGEQVYAKLENAAPADAIVAFRRWKQLLDAHVYKILPNQQVLYGTATKWKLQIKSTAQTSELAGALIVEVLDIFLLLHSLFPEAALESSAIDLRNFRQWEDEDSITSQLAEPYKTQAESILSRLESKKRSREHDGEDIKPKRTRQLPNKIATLDQFWDFIKLLKKKWQTDAYSSETDTLYSFCRGCTGVESFWTCSSPALDKDNQVFELGVTVLKYFFECDWMVEFYARVVEHVLPQQSAVARKLLLLFEHHSKSDVYFQLPSIDAIELNELPKSCVQTANSIDSQSITVRHRLWPDIQAALARLVSALVSKDPAALASPSLLAKMFGEYTATTSKKDRALFELLKYAHCSAKWDVARLVEQQALRLGKTFAASEVVSNTLKRHLAHKPFDALYAPLFVKAAFVRARAKTGDYSCTDPHFAVPLLVEAMKQVIDAEYSVDVSGLSPTCDWTEFFKAAIPMGFLDVVIDGLCVDSKAIRLQSLALLKFFIERHECSTALKEQAAVSLLLCKLYFSVKFDAGEIPEQIPGVWGLFLKSCLHVFVSPGHWQYEHLQLLVERHVAFEFSQQTPFTSALLFSSFDSSQTRPSSQSLLQGHREQLFMFNLLCDGFVNAADEQLYKRFHLTELLLVLVECGLIPGEQKQNLAKLEALLELELQGGILASDTVKAFSELHKLSARPGNSAALLSSF